MTINEVFDGMKDVLTSKGFWNLLGMFDDAGISQADFCARLFKFCMAFNYARMLPSDALSAKKARMGSSKNVPLEGGEGTSFFVAVLAVDR